MARMSPEELAAAREARDAGKPAPRVETAPAASASPIPAEAVTPPVVTAAAPNVLPQENMSNFATNPYKKWIYLAQAVDSWRIWPRAFLTVYVILVYKTTDWFMTLPDPNMQQAGLISVVVGAGAAWFGLYLGSSPRK